MKRNLFAVALLVALTVSAAPTGYIVSWDPYPVADATIQVSCGLNSGPKSLSGSALASVGQVAVTLDVQPGDDIQCTAVAVKGVDSSPSAQEATLHVPLVLPAPVLRIRGA